MIQRSKYFFSRLPAVMVRFAICALILLYSHTSFAQPKEKEHPATVFGIQISPIIPNNLIQKNDRLLETDSVKMGVTGKMSYMFGMEMRHYFTRLISLQTGINFIRRNYSISIFDTCNANPPIDSAYSMRFIGYEVPLMNLIYIRLSKNIYMDNAFGACFNFYPSDIWWSPIYGGRRTWVQISLLANVGWELRTENSGYVYIGASYQLHFKDMLYFLYFSDGNYAGKADAYLGTPGNYFTVNLKYFFPMNKK